MHSQFDPMWRDSWNATSESEHNQPRKRNSTMQFYTVAVTQAETVILKPITVFAETKEQAIAVAVFENVPALSKPESVPARWNVKVAPLM